jgi:hypothetical protein
MNESDRIEELEECLRKVLEESFSVQFTSATEETVRLANDIFHIALEADTNKNYYAPPNSK